MADPPDPTLDHCPQGSLTMVLHTLPGQHLVVGLPPRALGTLALFDLDPQIDLLGLRPMPTIPDGPQDLQPSDAPKIDTNRI